MASKCDWLILFPCFTHLQAGTPVLPGFLPYASSLLPSLADETSTLPGGACRIPFADNVNVMTNHYSLMPPTASCRVPYAETNLLHKPLA